MQLEAWIALIVFVLPQVLLFGWTMADRWTNSTDSYTNSGRS